MKKAIIIIISVLVIILATCTCLYFFTDVFNFLKPTKDNFSIQAKKLLGAKSSLSYSEYLESIESLKTKDESYISTGNISFNVNLPSSFSSASTQRILNNTSISTTSSYDKSQSATSNNVKISYNNNDIFNINTVKKGSVVDIQASDLYDKPLRFDFDKYESFRNANSIDEKNNPFNTIKNQVESYKNSDNSNFLYDLLYLTEDEYKAIHKNYGNILNDAIDKENFSSKKNQQITVGDDEINATAYTLTLSPKDISKAIEKIVGKAKDDSTLRDIIVKKYELLNKYTSNIAKNSYSRTSKNGKKTELPENLSSSDVEELIDKLIGELKDSESNLSDIKDSIRITIYADKKQNPVRMEMAFVTNDDKETVFLSENVEEGKNTYTIDIEKISNHLSKSTDSTDDGYTSLYGTSSSNAISSLKKSISKLTIVDKYSSTDTSRKGTVTISAKISDTKQELLTIEYDTVFSKKEIKNCYTISSPVYSGISAKYEFGIQGLNEDTKKINLNISGKLSFGFSTMQVELKANGETTYGKSDVKEFTEVEDVFAKAGADFQALTDKIFENASNNLPSKLSTFGINLTKENILSMKEFYFKQNEIATNVA